MFYALLLVSISLIGFLLASILFSKRKANSYYNKYAVALILIISLRIFLVGLHLTFKKEILEWIVLYSRPLVLIAFPILYAYIKSILNVSKSKNEISYKFLLAPIILFVFIILKSKGYESEDYHNVVFGSYFLTPIAMVSFVLWHFILTLKNYLEFAKNQRGALKFSNDIKIIKVWSAIITGGIGFSLISLIIMFIRDYKLMPAANEFLLLLNALFWLYCFFRMFNEPLLLYGISGVEKISKPEAEIWLKAPRVISSDKDISLQRNMYSKIDLYKTQIEAFLSDTDSFKTNEFNLTVISQKTNIPASHISFMIRVYSKYTMNELKNFLRIKEAEKLLALNDSNLKLKEVSLMVGYKSYTSFYEAYKKFGANV
jgi:AraC-like DNA-binding protein